MDSREDTPSSALLAAQQQLFARRKQLQKEGKQGAGRKLSCVDGDRTPSNCVSNNRLSSLPAHLGWDSAPLTAVLRNANHSHPQTVKQNPREPLREAENRAETAVSTLPSSAWPPNPHDKIKLFPDIARGMLRQEQTAAGRIWWLSRYLDREGKGWLRVVNLRHTLTSKQAPLRVCGWRQLRNLLRQGNGIFWTRDKTRIWLKSAANVAATLGIERLTGKPVSVPVKVFISSIGHVRSHLYAAFHSGRTRDDQQKLIARETLTELTGVGRCTQLTYESQAGLSVQHNYAVGERYSPETAVKPRLASWSGHICITGQLRRAGGSQGEATSPGNFPTVTVAVIRMHQRVDNDALIGN